MSVLKWQCRELRRLADKLGNEKEVSVSFVRVLVIPIMREAANTIESLREMLQGGTCEFEINTDMTAVKCSECGYKLPKGADLDATRFCGGCGKTVKR